MDNAGEPFSPVLVSGKEYDAVAAALPPLLEEMKRQHAERRRRGDRSTRKTASLLQRGSGAGFLGFLGFLHKFTISFREHLSTTMSASSGPGSSSMLEPEPLRKVSAHAGNDPSRAKCRLESTAEPVKCVRGKHEADSTPPSVRCCTNDRARSLRRHAAELSGFSIVLDSGGTGSLNRWTASYAFALR